jgi:hypothetical protein
MICSVIQIDSFWNTFVLFRYERDVRLTSLFRRWPRVSEPERAELRKVYDERVRLAKHVGSLRRRGTRL